VWQEYAPQGLVLLSLTDESEKVVAGALERYKIDMPEFPIGFASRSKNAYGVSGIPSAFLLNYDGEIVWQGPPGGNEWVRMLPGLLQEAKDAGPNWDPGARPDDFSKAVAFAKDGKMRNAVSAAERLRKSDAANVDQFIADMKDCANRRLAQGVNMANAHKPQQAINYLERQIDSFKGTGFESEMLAEVKRIKSDSKLKALISLDKKRLAAIDNLRKGNREKAIKSLKSIKKKAKGTPFEDVMDTWIAFLVKQVEG
jgi:hypothetical protein